MQDAPKAVWSILYVSMAFFPSLKQNFIVYRSFKVSDCIFEIHQLWQSGFSRVYSNSCCSCSFEAEIIKIGQSSHKMYSNNLLNFEGFMTILNACTKKVWKLIVYTSYFSQFVSITCCSHLFQPVPIYLVLFASISALSYLYRFARVYFSLFVLILSCSYLFQPFCVNLFIYQSKYFKVFVAVYWLLLIVSFVIEPFSWIWFFYHLFATNTDRRYRTRSNGHFIVWPYVRYWLSFFKSRFSFPTPQPQPYT